MTPSKILEALDDVTWVGPKAARELAQVLAVKLNEQPADPQPIAAGFWCSDCGFLEEEDIDDERCDACGCSRDSHIEVSVIPA